MVINFIAHVRNQSGIINELRPDVRTARSITNEWMDRRIEERKDQKMNGQVEYVDGWTDR